MAISFSGGTTTTTNYERRRGVQRLLRPVRPPRPRPRPRRPRYYQEPRSRTAPRFSDGRGRSVDDDRRRRVQTGEAVAVTIHSTTIQLGTFTANSHWCRQRHDNDPGRHRGRLPRDLLDRGNERSRCCDPRLDHCGEPATLSSSTGSPAASAGSTSGGTTAGGTPSANGGSLAYTGAGHGVWLTLLVGVLLLDLGYVLITTFLRPRELLTNQQAGDTTRPGRLVDPPSTGTTGTAVTFRRFVTCDF